MSVFGIVNTSDEDAICEPLAMSFPLLFFDNEWLMVSLARVCAALKAGVRELTEQCLQLHKSRRKVPKAVALARLRFPYQDSVDINGVTISLKYVEVIHRFVFVAKLGDGSEREVIVKFAKRYGHAVHQLCSLAGFAPALLGYESLRSGWSFVVMEKLRLVSLVRAKTDRTIVRDQLRKIESTLAAAAFVHGDLRESNVLWDPVQNRVVLIDVDWAGKDGAVFYPPFMNTESAWPPGAQCGKPLRTAHDAYWLDAMKCMMKVE